MIEDQHLKLSELASKIHEVLTSAFGSEEYWIVAEISSHKFYPNNDRHYFEFIEKEEGSTDPIAKIRGVSWRLGSEHIKSFERATGQIFSNGIEVLAKVKIEFHQSHGLQLILQNIDPTFTLGNIEKQRRATLLRLLSENMDAIELVGEEYVTRNKRLAFNLAIQNLAIIGSPKSEGYTDFIDTVNKNQYGYKFNIDIFQSAVQGMDAVRALVDRLVFIYKSNKKYDCVVIIRGGGSKTDFLVFDQYDISRAVARFPIPIITGIGHTRDVSIVDLMANTQTKTPTKAAEFIISHNRFFEERVLTMQKAIVIKSQGLLAMAHDKTNRANVIVINKSRTLISHHKDELIKFNQTVVNKTKTVLYNLQSNLGSLLNKLLSKPQTITSNRQNDLAHLVNNIQVNSKRYLTNQKGYLGHHDSVIRLMSPRNILKKGFAIISHKGNIIKNAEGIAAGEELTVSLEYSEINTKVISNTKTDGTKYDV